MDDTDLLQHAIYHLNAADEHRKRRKHDELKADLNMAKAKIQTFLDSQKEDNPE